MGETFKNLILLCISVIICIIFLEFVLRMLYPLEYHLEREHTLTDYGVFGRMSYFEYTHTTSEFSYAYSYNSKGLRDYEYSYEKNPLTYRIIVVGDSFTEGTGVEFEDSMPKVLERKLKRAGNYEVINFGFGGYGLLPEAIIIEEEVMKYKPDMIILNYFVGNDLTKLSLGAFNNVPAEFWMKEQHELLKKEVYSLKLKTKFKNFLRRNFILYRFIKEKFIYKIIYRTSKDIQGVIEETSPVIFKENYPDYLNRNLNTTHLIFDFLKRFTQDDNITFLVVLTPTKEQVRPDLFEVGGDLEKPQRLLKEQLSLLGINFLDILPVLKGSDEIVYWKIDGHLNKKGYEIVADRIYTEIPKIQHLP